MVQPKVIAVLVITAVVAVVAYLSDQVVLAAVVAVIGLVGAYLLVRSADGAGGGSGDFMEVERDDAPFEPRSGTGTRGGLSTWAPPVSDDVEPLSTWTPGPGADEPLTPWQPDEPLPTYEEPATFDEPQPQARAPRPAPRTRPEATRPTPSRPTRDRADSIFATPRPDVDEPSLAPFEAAPLDSWDNGGAATPEVDEQAEIDRASRVLAGETQINEEVATADDIMAASEATELHLSPAASGDDGELAKLLAKVQARLAAYE